MIINPNVHPYNFVYITILEYERVESILIGLYIRLCYKSLISSSHDVSGSLLVFTLKPRALFRVDFPGKKKKRCGMDLEKGQDIYIGILTETMKRKAVKIKLLY